MIKRLVLAGAALMAFAHGVSAATMEWPSSYAWKGLWLGAYAGGLKGVLTGPNASGSTGPTGTTFGFDGFYNFQHGNFVFGPYVAIPWGGAAGTASGATTSFDGAFIGGGRLGYAFGHVLPYVFGAFITARASVSGFGLTATAAHNGTVLGAGIDVGVTERISLGVRYNHAVIYPSTALITGASSGWVGDTVVGTVNFKIVP